MHSLFHLASYSYSIDTQVAKCCVTLSGWMDQDGLAASKASTSPLEGRDAFYSNSGRPRFCAIFSVFARFCAHILRPLHHYAISFLHCQPLFLPLNDFAPIITARRYSLTTLMFHIHQTNAKQVRKITSFYIHISFTK